MWDLAFTDSTGFGAMLLAPQAPSSFLAPDSLASLFNRLADVFIDAGKNASTIVVKAQ